MSFLPWEAKVFFLGEANVGEANVGEVNVIAPFSYLALVGVKERELERLDGLCFSP